MITEAKARAIADRVLARARTHKGAEASVSVGGSATGNSRFARNTITSSADVERIGVSVTVLLGQRSATASTNQTDDASLAEVVDRAARLAALAPENPETMPVLGKQSYPHATASDGGTSRFGAKQRATAVGAALKLAGKHDVAGFYAHGTSLTARATSAGLWAIHETTSCNFSCTARTPDGSGSGWAGTQSYRVADLDTEALAKIAVDKATRSANPKRLDAGRYTVVLEPAAVAALLGFLIGNLGARRADEGRSFFAKPGGGTRIGEKLFPDTITLRSDPADAATSGMPFDGEGLPTPATRWIDGGKLTALTYGRYWAKHQGKPATGSPSGWTLDGGKASVTDLLKGIQRGVLITRFWYLRDLDPQSLLATGLTRDGTFLVENGAITTPVNNFRFNESPVHMLAQCDALGVPWVATGDGAGTRAPALRTHEFNLASISEAV